MKRILIVCLILAGMPAFAQRTNHSKAPEAVRIAFSKRFAGVDDPRWEKEKGKYEATFRQDGQKTSATWDDKGNWLETEREISVKSLPADALLYIEQHYSGRNARAASIITLASGESNYEAHINYKDLIFDGKGKFLREEKD